MTWKHWRRSAFTLIELVMVIVIIAALSAIIVPNYINYTAKSQAATTKANLQILRTSVQNYTADNNGAFPANLAALVTAGYLRAVPADGGGVATSVAARDNTGGWVYVAATGEVQFNDDDTDPFGVEEENY